MSPTRQTVALVAVLTAALLTVGSVAFAAGLAANSVGTKQLKRNAVATAKIKNGAVTGAKIKNGSVGRSDLAAGVVAPPSTYVKRTIATNATVTLATVGGLDYIGSCTPVGGGTWYVEVRAVPADGSSNTVTASMLGWREDDAGDEVFTVSETRPGSSYSAGVVAGSLSSRDAGASGTLQLRDLTPSRVDLTASVANLSDVTCSVVLTVSPLR